MSKKVQINSKIMKTSGYLGVGLVVMIFLFFTGLIIKNGVEEKTEVIQLYGEVSQYSSDTQELQ